ncbi:hypothetical protein EDC94DRAFT_335707 [Helicostylum pulchrum]|nr:hypothetical protein EDC94DRAFT_335707 [Helicostylum pulchrum]
MACIRPYALQTSITLPRLVLSVSENFFTLQELRIINPEKKKTKSVNGSFVCYNQECVSVLASKNTHGRDSLSAFAIGLSGLAMLTFGATFPTFAPNTSHFKTEFFNQKAVAFLNRNAKRPTVDDV